MRISDWSSDVCSSDLADGETPADRLLQAVRRGEIFKLGCDHHTTPQMGIQRLRQHCPARHINSDPITVQRNLKPPSRAEFRVGAPAHIGRHPGSPPDPPPSGAFSGDSRRNPTVNHVPLPPTTPPPFPLYRCTPRGRHK